MTQPIRILTRRCETYTDAERVIGEMLEGMEAAALLAGRKVLVKVNLMLGGPPEEGTNTHPAVAAALVRYIRDQGGEVDVADSSGALGLTDACFVRSGMRDAVERAGGRCINLDAMPMQRAVIRGKILKQLVLPRCLDEYQVIVSAAKFKVHPLTKLTGAVKNMMGIAPGAVKPAIHHRHARTVRRLAEALVDLYTMYKPSLCLIDGIIGREAGGSTDGFPVRTNFLGTSRDGLALDAFCSHLMGLPPTQVPILVCGARRGAGEIDPEKWEVAGDGPRERGALALKPAPRDKKANPLIAFAAYFLRDHAVRPVFPKEGCETCDECIQSCPVDALESRGGRIFRSRLRCVGCYRCVYACEKGLVRLHVKGYARATFWRKAAGLPTDRFIRKPGEDSL